MADADAETTAADELRRRATGGATLLVARGVLIFGFGIGANLVLARLLAPRDFGLVALGSVLFLFGGYLASGGFGAALVRHEQPPERHVLAAVNGLQLAATIGLAALVAAVAIPFGRDGYVVAVMVATLPVTILRAPSTIVLERRLSYRTIATVDVLDAAAFYTWSIVTVALGMGVWGVATAMAVRAVVGTAAMAYLGPVGLVRPRWSWSAVRPLLGFGATVQLISVVGVARDQGINFATAAVGGVATLGVWNLAFRVLQVPAMLFIAASRVSYPAMSRLLAGRQDPRPAIESGVANVTVATGVVLVATAGFAPALPAVVGDGWHEVPATLALACGGLIVGAPVYVVAVGYLYAADRADAVLRSMVAYTAVALAVAVPLIAPLGAPAVGAGWLASSVANAIVLSLYTRRATGAAMAASLLPPAAIAAAAGAAGWVVATAGSGSVVHGILGAVAGELVLLAGLALVRPALLRTAYALAVDAATSAGPLQTESAVETPASPTETTPLRVD